MWEIQAVSAGKIVYVLDEPTTALRYFETIQKGVVLS
jgi:excinuclease UvrABC ATPase subunit